MPPEIKKPARGGQTKKTRTRRVTDRNLMVSRFFDEKKPRLCAAYFSSADYSIKKQKAGEGSHKNNSQNLTPRNFMNCLNLREFDEPINAKTAFRRSWWMRTPILIKKDISCNICSQLACSNRHFKKCINAKTAFRRLLLRFRWA